MRFRRLSLDAFGPFTGMELLFPRAAGDFHVVIGPNEAGKSSMLRAIGDVLFGIPVHSSDNFQHAHENMVMRAEVEGRNGDSLSFKRRKRNAPNDLLDDQGEVLPRAALGRYLGTVDRERFEALFGLSSERLQSGAEYLMSDKGALAQTLFAAGTGLASVNASIKKLRAEMETLYKPTGRKLVVNVLKKDWETHREASMHEMLSPREWTDVQDDLGRVEAKRQRLQAELKDFRQTQEWLVRCCDSLPSISSYREKQEGLREYASLPSVSSDFTKRIRAAWKLVNDLGRELTKLTEEIREREADIAKVASSPLVAEKLTLIESLHQRVEAYRQDVLFVTERAGKLREVREQLEATARDLEIEGGIDGLEARILPSKKQNRLREAATRYGAAMDAVRERSGELAKCRQNVGTLAGELDALQAGETSTLQSAVEAARAIVELPGTLSAGAGELERTRGELTILHGQLWGAPEDWDQVCQLRIVPMATIETFEARENELRMEMGRRSKEMEDARSAIALGKEELSSLERRGELPSAAELREARAYRDRGWKAVLAAWRGIPAAEAFVAEGSLEEAYPRAVAHADGIADQLRNEADSVARAEATRQRMANQEEAIELARQALEEGRRALDALMAEWRMLWANAGVEPRSPVEMRAWRGDWTRFLEIHGKWSADRDRWKRDSERLQSTTEALATALGHSGRHDFTPLLKEAEEVLRAALEDIGRRKLLTDQLRQEKDRLAALEAQLELDSVERTDAGVAWKDACEALGYLDELSPTSGVSLLEAELKLRERYNDFRLQSSDFEASEKRVRDFEKELFECAKALGVTEGTAEAVEAQLWNLGCGERKASQRLEQLRESCERLAGKLQDVRIDHETATQQLRDLLKVVALTTTEGLEEVLARIEAREHLLKTLEETRELLLAPSRGEDLDHFMGRVLAEDVGTIDTRRRELAASIHERETELKSLEKRSIELLASLQLMEASTNGAAQARQMASMAEASLAETSLRYVRLSLAAHVLESQIDAFRRASQGPLMTRGSALFSRITGGAFTSLIIEPDDRGEPEIQAVRKNNGLVRPKAMSSGTRDQLFLALRMAALELHAEEHEPMPLILDDLLITFDDHRSAAILREFRRLADTTQVLLFTHHQHLVDLCRQELALPDSHIHAV